MWIQSLDQEDPLEKEMATHSGCLRNPMDRGILSIGLQRVRYDLVTKQQQNQNEIFAYFKNYTYSLKIYGK